MDGTLTLRDGSDIRISTSQMAKALQVTQESVKDPIFYCLAIEDPSAVRLLCDAIHQNINMSNAIPPTIPLLCCLSHLCMKYDCADVCKAPMRLWISQWLRARNREHIADLLPVACQFGVHVRAITRICIVSSVRNEQVASIDRELQVICPHCMCLYVIL
jgi:hypothetical protein